MGYGALGGGTWTAMTKGIPGSYINVVSKTKSQPPYSNIGKVGLAVPLDWGIVGDLIIIDRNDFEYECLAKLGYDFAADEMKPFRDLFKGATKAYIYNLNENGVKAKATVGTLEIEAKKPGIAGNTIQVVIQKDIDIEDRFIVKVYMQEQEVLNLNLTKDDVLPENEFIEFKGDVTLTEEHLTAGTFLTGGTNGEAVDKSVHVKFLEIIESMYVNTIAYIGNDEETRKLYTANVIRLRENEGIKVRLVYYANGDNLADYPGIVEVYNTTLDNPKKPYELTYWVLGQLAGCELGETLVNKKYDGEYNFDSVTNTRDARNLLKNGKFVLYKVDGENKILDDINSYISYQKATNGDDSYLTEDFKNNQVIATVDQRSIDIAYTFNNRFIGEPNDTDGRIALWNALVKGAENLQKTRAISNYKDTDTEVLPGNEKHQVIVNEQITPTVAMKELYVTIYVI